METRSTLYHMSMYLNLSSLVEYAVFLVFLIKLNEEKPCSRKEKSCSTIAGPFVEQDFPR